MWCINLIMKCWWSVFTLLEYAWCRIHHVCLGIEMVKSLGVYQIINHSIYMQKLFCRLQLSSHPTTLTVPRQVWVCCWLGFNTKYLTCCCKISWFHVLSGISVRFALRIQFMQHDSMNFPCFFWLKECFKTIVLKILSAALERCMWMLGC